MFSPFFIACQVDVQTTDCVALKGRLENMPQVDRNMFTGPSDRSYPHLSIIVDGSHLKQFFLLLQQGVKIRRRVGCSVDVFLRQEIGVTPETIEKIQSIMLDGKPVDDTGSSLLQDGSTLALSAALPGLVGATLRRGGAYSSFRSVITYHETGKACALGEGWVCVKIFNLMMAEMGPDLLRTGVHLRSSDLFSFLMEQKEDFRARCSATLDGKTLDIGMLDGSSELVGQDYVLLTVAISPVNA